MIDTLLRLRDSARNRETPARLGLKSREYVLATLHRPENVDEPKLLGTLLEALAEISRLMPVVFPVHPRTRERIEALGYQRFIRDRVVIASDALGYLDFIGLMADARLVVTDSGGVQEETTVLGIPCLTVRETTERPVTVTHGTNTVVGRDPDRLVRKAAAIVTRPPLPKDPPELWDGRAGERIVRHLSSHLADKSLAAQIVS
jgi:UDP-N-acetylglucosamine 2-epimerase (non-hydrolysing)